MSAPPHLPALPSDYEEKPDFVIPSWFRPLMAVSHKVKDGEDFFSIAAHYGMPAKELVRYNFQTNDVREINWYLRNRVGCKKYGPEKKNFAFSASADPGIIWIPHYAAKRVPTGPKAPTGEKIIKNFPRYVQSSDNTCWGAAVANIYDWKRYKNRKADEALDQIDFEWGEKYRNGDFLQGWDFKRLAKGAGLKSLSIDGFYDRWDWADTIDRNKPVLMLQKHDEVWTHWIIIVGYRVVADGTMRLIYIDPGDGSRYSSSRQYLVDQCRAAASNYPKLWRF